MPYITQLKSASRNKRGPYFAVFLGDGEPTCDAIIAAGQEMQAAGRNITACALRQKVGGGNPTRLKQVWDEFAESLEVMQTQPIAELPVEVAEAVASGSKELTARLDSCARDINDHAIRAADRRVGDVLKSASEPNASRRNEIWPMRPRRLMT